MNLSNVYSKYKMKSFIISAIAMLSFAMLNFARESHALEHKDLVGKVVKLPGPDEIYIGAGFSADKQPIYYGMERLDKPNAENWFKYTKPASDGYLYSEYSKLRQLYQSIITNKPLSASKLEDQFGAPAYVDSLKKLMESRKDKLKSFFVKGDQGFQGIESVLRRSDPKKYMVYASKSPITGRFKPKGELSDPSSETLQDISKAFGDLIMFMGLIDNEGYPTTTHRGIQKNPLYSVMGKYADFSLQFHGFAGAVAAKFFKDKKYMLVAPVPAMTEIIQKKVGPNDMFVGFEENCKSQQEMASKPKTKGYTPVCITEVGKFLYIGVPKEEPPHTIKLEALQRIYSAP